MKNKVTLITPPDFFENDSLSILLVDLVDYDQSKVTNWLTNLATENPINIYFYLGEQDPTWLLYALSKSKVCFLDIDNASPISSALHGYLLSKPHVYYQTRNELYSTVFSHINSNRVPDIDLFLEEVGGRLQEDTINNSL